MHASMAFMPTGKYERTPETRQRMSETRRGRKCLPGCTCGHHTRTEYKSCDPGCTCARHEQTEEHRRKNSEANQGHEVSEETRRKISEANTGNARGVPAKGYFIDKRGYKRLTMADDHPLADPRNGHVLESRMVLYDDIGDGTHPCHWCGKSLEWGGLGGILADHVDGDKLNNDISNLVPSCNPCNIRRANAGNPADWSSNGH